MGMEVNNNVYRLLLSFIVTAFVSAAQNLSFIEPIIPPNVDEVALPYYTAGDEVTISWVTPFEKTTLLVYQLRDNHNWAYGILAGMYLQLCSRASPEGGTWCSHRHDIYAFR